MPDSEPKPPKVSPPTTPLLRSKLTGSRLRILFYQSLRLHYERLWAFRQLIGVRSYNSLAADLQVSGGTFVRLMDFISLYYVEIEQARSSGDWSAVEDRIFGNHGDFRKMKSFREMMARIDPDSVQAEPTGALPKKKRGRPPGRKNRLKPPLTPEPIPSFWAKLVGLFRSTPPEKSRRQSRH